MLEIMRCNHVQRALFGCILMAILIPESASSAQALAVSSFGRSIGVYTFRHMNGRRYEQGDTLRVRHVLYNVSDSVTVVRTHGCGFVLNGTLELTDIRGAGSCEATLSQLSPGDSAWAQMTGVIASEPGEYTIQLQSISLPRYDADVRPPTETRITVVPTGTSPTSPRSSRFEPMMPKLPYVVHLTGDSTLLSMRDFDSILLSALREYGFLPMQASEVAAEAIAEIWPYLSLDVDIDERGRYQLRTEWNTRVRRTIDPPSVAVPRRTTCRGGSNGLAARAVLFGAMLVEEIRKAVTGYQSGRCGV